MDIRKLARKHAGNDKLLASVIERHLEYTRYSKPRAIRKEGIDFYVVGHNSSHVYSFGVKDGELWSYVIGESLELDEDGFPKHEETISKSEGFGYCGHL